MKSLFTYTLLFLVYFQLDAATITFNAQRSALVSVHPDIKTVAIIDRTVATNRGKDQLEGVLTGEGLNGDKKAIQAAMSGLAESLTRSGRYRVVHTTDALVGSSHAGDLPIALNWKKVQQLCEKYSVDAIIVLEHFDSDYIVTKGRKEGESLRFFASGLAKVDLGFRFYDPIQQSIIDQHNFSFTNRFNSVNGSIQEAITGLLNRSNAISEISYSAASDYASRLTPSWYKISRIYFQKSKKDKDLARGARMMEANDWDEALKALKIAAEKGHRKTRGKAAHNIAVVYEIFGELKLAKEWATIAWGDHENRISKDYSYKLGRRIREQSFIKKQMGS